MRSLEAALLLPSAAVKTVIVITQSEDVKHVADMVHEVAGGRITSSAVVVIDIDHTQRGYEAFAAVGTN